MKIGFFEIEEWEAEYLKEKLDGNETSFTSAKLEEGNVDLAKDREAISIFTGSKINSDVLAALPNLKLIATRTTGFDHIDLEAAKAKGIMVCSVPSYGENTVAEFAFGLLLNVSRKIYKAFDRIRETGSYNLEGLRGFDLKGKTFGVIGTGRIGQEIRVIAQAQEQNQVKLDTAIGNIQNRNGVAKFFIGPNFGAINDAERIIVNNQQQIQVLTQLQGEVTSTADQQQLTNQINVLQQTNTQLNAYVQAQSNGFSVFGWLVKLFVK